LTEYGWSYALVLRCHRGRPGRSARGADALGGPHSSKLWRDPGERAAAQAVYRERARHRLARLRAARGAQEEQLAAAAGSRGAALAQAAGTGVVRFIRGAALGHAVGLLGVTARAAVGERAVVLAQRVVAGERDPGGAAASAPVRCGPGHPGGGGGVHQLGGNSQMWLCLRVDPDAAQVVDSQRAARLSRPAALLVRARRERQSRPIRSSAPKL
jgi:hypothetical protein